MKTKGLTSGARQSLGSLVILAASSEESKAFRIRMWMEDLMTAHLRAARYDTAIYCA
jgi:hypothetical protein